MENCLIPTVSTYGSAIVKKIAWGNSICIRWADCCTGQGNGPIKNGVCHLTAARKLWTIRSGHTERCSLVI